MKVEDLKIVSNYQENEVIERNSIIKGDCLEVMKGIKDKSVDMILCDLPFGLTACKWDEIIPFEPLWEQYKRIIKDNGAIVLFGSQPFTSKLIMSNIDMFRYEWIWEKNNSSNFQLVKYQPLKIHESILIFYKNNIIMEFANIMKENMAKLNLKKIDIAKLELSKNGNITGWVTNKLNGSQLPTLNQWIKICKLFKIQNNYYEILNSIKRHTYNPILRDINKKVSNKGKGGKLNHLVSEKKRDIYYQSKTDYPKSILKFNRENSFHPTQKPTALLEYLIKIYTLKGELILDNTAGSMSTAIASINTNRDFIMIEKDDKYFEIGVERIKNHLLNQEQM